MLSISGIHIQTLNNSSRRGGSFFTMLIFVMLLISTALMYYYFQRTRFLERQIAALQRGEQPEGSSLSEFVSWVKGPDAADSDEASPAAPMSTPRPAAPTPVATPTAAQHTLPETASADALATPGPEVTLPPVDEISTRVQQLEQPDTFSAQDTLPEETPASRRPDGNQQEEVQPPADPNRPINSIYDTPEAPPVRVRSPQRN